MEYSVYMIEMNKPDFFKVATFIGASLKPSLCSAQDLGATDNMDIREKNLQIISFEQIRYYIISGEICKVYDPASS